jgi:hypothetical protein
VKNPPKRVQLTKSLTCSQIVEFDLEEFVTSNSMKFFEILKLKTDFLEEDPEVWASNVTFQNGLKVVSSLKVVNDCAERGVKLITDYLQAGHTKDEKQLQYLLQVVKKHREDVPVLTKEAVIQHAHGSKSY